MVFFFVALIGMYIGRKLGWFLSKNLLYAAPLGVTLAACVAWGTLAAFGIYSLIQWQHPNIVNRIIMGYALGSYVSCPNYGLLDESTVPREVMQRHVLVKIVPLVVYVLSSVAFAILLP